MPEGTGDGVPSAHHRTLWLWSNLVGQLVMVHCRDGKCWEGLLQAKDGDGMSVALTNGRLRQSKTSKSGDKTKLSPVLKIDSDDVLYVQCVDVSLAVREVKGIHGADGLGANNERDLVKWDAGEVLEEDLEAPTRQHVAGQWNQFEANAKQFQYKSSYTEEFYTTKLDKTKFTREQIEKAERITQEIEGKGGGSNDCAAWADDYDEEAAFSAVPRESDPVTQIQYKAALAKIAEGSYIPPHLRGKVSMQPAKDQPGNGAPPQQPQPAETPNPDPQYQRDGALQVRADQGAPARIPQDCYRETDGSPVQGGIVQQQQQQQQQQPPQQLQPAANIPTPAPAMVEQVTEAPKPSPQAALAALPVTKRTALTNKNLLTMRGRMVHDPARAKLRTEASDPQSRASAIAAFKEESKRFTETFKKTMENVKEPLATKKEQPTQEAVDNSDQQSTQSQDGLDTPQKKKLNPGAAPFVLAPQKEEEEQQATPPKVDFTPAPEPEWKVSLSEKAKENKFICKIIADGIYGRIKSTKPQPQQGANPMQQVPIPGDPTTFIHEWDGDDYYWDEENDSDTENKGHHGQQSNTSSVPPGPPYNGHMYNGQSQYVPQGGAPPQQQMPNPNMQHEMHHMPAQRMQPSGYSYQQPPPQQQWPSQPPPNYQQGWNPNTQGQYSQPPAYNQPQYPVQHQQPPQHMGYQNPPGMQPPMRPPAPQFYPQPNYPAQQPPGGPGQQQPPPQQPSQGQHHMYAPPQHHDPNMHPQGHLPPSSHAGGYGQPQHMQRQQQYGQVEPAPEYSGYPPPVQGQQPQHQPQMHQQVPARRPQGPQPGRR